MAEIFDLLARVSWDTNTEALQGVNKELTKEDRLLDELRQKGIRLEQQQKQTHDPKKVQSMNAALAQNKKAQDSIITSQKEQIKQTELLRQKQQQLAAQMARTNDPQAMRGLLGGLKSVTGELATAGRAAGGFMAALGVGVGAFGAQAAVQGIFGLISNSLDEIQQAEQATKGLKLALDAVGQGKYLTQLLDEASKLSEEFGNIYDNDEIVQAQTELVKYGKVTRGELEQLTKVSIELASAQGTDLVTASNKIVDILAGRGAATLRDFGLSTKDATTDTERMNLVLTDLAGKLNGATEAYANTAAGIKKQNEVLIADLQEQIGEKLLPIYVDALQGINNLLSGEWEKITSTMVSGSRRMISLLSPILADFKRLYDFGAGFFGDDAKPNSSDDIKAQWKKMYKAALDAQKEEKKKFTTRPDEEPETKKEAEKNVKSYVKAANTAAKKPENIVRVNVELTSLSTSGISAPAATATEGIGQGSMDAADRMIQQKVALDNIRFIQQAAAKRREEEKRAEREQLFSSLQNAASEAQQIIAIEQAKTDRLIELQQERIEAARNNSAVSLKIEEDRQQELLEKRRKYERAQRAIDAAVIVANQAVAISGAIRAITNAGGNPVLIAANAVAIAAGIAAAVFSVRNAFSDPGFKEGGYTGDGDPNQESTAVGRKPYKYHKGEFVMDADLTADHRDLFEGIHKRRLKVRQLDDGQYYIAPDVDKLSADYQTAKYSTQDGQVLAELSAMRRLLQQRELNVTNNFDAEGFGQAVAGQMVNINLKHNRRN